MERVKKKISIGVEDLKDIIEKNGYFVDKSEMIRDLIDSNVKVTLFTRPRRFGKTLNQSMIRRFFEDERTAQGERVDNRWIFENLAVSRLGEEYLKHQQQYPVINLSMKSGKQPDFQTAYKNLKAEIQGEFSRHQYVLEMEKLEERLKAPFAAILHGKGEDADYSRALRILSECLEKYHGRKAIILIDEYDVPLENAFLCGFYDQMSGFIRGLLESALKTNDFLEFAVITGCLRISKESIFTGLNNLKTDSVLHTAYGTGFGFTEEEVKAILDYYNMGKCFAEVKDWYDGYRFGRDEIYNPWSILNYVEDHLRGVAEYPQPYWSNTSSNSIVRELIQNADVKTRQEVELLMAGHAIEKPVHEDVTYDDVYRTQDNLWNFLYFTGYLKSEGEAFRNLQLYLNLRIPNREVETIYKDTIREWMNNTINSGDIRPLRQALEAGDCRGAEEFLCGKLMKTISYYDYAENFYHGFLVGLLEGMGSYLVRSNQESGTGRPDLILKTPQVRSGLAMIFEIKVTNVFQRMEDECRDALNQIEERKYEEGLREEGYERIIKYGICFYKKECLLMKAEKSI